MYTNTCMLEGDRYMWNDIETTTDYLHFSVVSKTVAELIIESGNSPISIGISGSWGAGKSSMVKMIGKDLNDQSGSDEYIFLEFNAWLYQGYEDAKSALLQAVTTKLTEEIRNKKINEKSEIGQKFKKFLKRVNWFQVSKLVFPLVAGVIPGAAPVGAIANFVNSIKSSLNNRGKRSENSEKINTAIEELLPELDGVFKDNEEMTEPATKQLEEIRIEFEEILEALKVKLVVLVDDLDRCMPETAISTLEAMRLLLFVRRTAFIIAADEQMIRNGVRAHFNGVELSDGLVTSYFDKLIQVPIKIPHLGVAEVKSYIVLGVDGTARNQYSYTVQKSFFYNVLNETEKQNGRILSIHSRGAVTEVLDGIEKSINKNIPIMHWFTGNAKELQRALSLGCWFSINPKMCYTKSGKDMVMQIPLNKMLPETDAPFTEKNGKLYMPWDTDVIEFLAIQYGKSIFEIKNQMEINLRVLNNSI